MLTSVFVLRTGLMETRCWRSGPRKSLRSTRVTGTVTASFYTVCTCAHLKEEEREKKDAETQLTRYYICLYFLSRMQTAQAELLYIKEVEKLDGFGQESFAAKVDNWNRIPPRPPSLTHTHAHLLSSRFVDSEKTLNSFLSHRTTTPTTSSSASPSSGCSSNTETADPSCSTSKPPTSYSSISWICYIEWVVKATFKWICKKILNTLCGKIQSLCEYCVCLCVCATGGRTLGP